VQANAVFLAGEEKIFEQLRARGWQFYTFIGGAARFMFAWDSDLERVNELAEDLKDCAAAACDPTERE
jgi:threonine aldolase